MDALLQWLSGALALLPAGLIAGVGIGAGAETVRWLKERSQRRKEQRYAGEAAALELVPLLTEFARECSNRWCENEYQGPYYSDMPKLPAFPDNLTWTALPQKTAGAIRVLPNEICAAERDIKFEEYPGQRYEYASRCYILFGCRASQIANDLRRHFGQGRYRSTTEFDFQSHLRREHRRLHRGWLRRTCDCVWHSRWVSRLKRSLRHAGKRTSSIAAHTGG